MDKMSIIVRYSRIFSERKLKEYDLSFSEQIIIMYLSMHDNVSQDNISRHFMIDKGMIAKTLNKLEKKGFITRKQNPENKRENIISLSDNGIGIIDRMGGILKEWNEIVYEGISKDDIEYVKKITKIMAENATKIIDIKS